MGRLLAGPRHRATHLGALDKVYDGRIGDHRKAIAVAGKVDPVTEDILIGQTAELEKFQWFVRAHLENAFGSLFTAGDFAEKGAARDSSA